MNDYNQSNDGVLGETASPFNTLSQDMLVLGTCVLPWKIYI